MHKPFPTHDASMNVHSPVSSLVPMVVTREGNNERAMDIYSMMLRERIVFMNGEVNDVMVSNLITQLLYLDHIDKGAPIQMNINSPGGSVHAGLALHDCMKRISSPVYTIVMGMAASMGSFIANAGEPGHRYVAPESTTMIHRVSSGTYGTQGTVHVTEMQHEDATRSLAHSRQLNKRLTELYAAYNTKGKDFDFFNETMRFDTYLTAQEAVDMGLADKVISSDSQIS